jgi:hypothetical protein
MNIDRKSVSSSLNFSTNRIVFLLVFLLLCTGCAKPQSSKIMETTAYCSCSSCCSWERGSWTYFKLDFWNRYVSGGSSKGSTYSGLTSSGTVPYEPEEGFFSVDSVRRPWMIPVRLILFPWYFLPHDGTIAADTRFYPFGTRMYIPGYGWGTVEDRGGAIKGPERIDLYFSSHQEALEWGRKKVQVTIQYPKP